MTIRRHSIALSIRLGAALLLALSLSGCTGMWDVVRESERGNFVDMARTQSKRGQCSEALGSLDRAQARLDLGSYSRESTVARARCYEKVGAESMAYAHRRLIDDFYTEEPMALPEADGSSVFRVKLIPSGGFSRPPGWVVFPEPRYSPYAQRSKIVGRVVVSFEIASNDRTKKIRVLEMPHPLLATWAIESVALGRVKNRPEGVNLMPGGRYVTTFLFEWRWAKEAPEEEFDS